MNTVPVTAPVVTKVTRYPAVDNCAHCDNLLVDRDDDMLSYRTEQFVLRQSRPVIEWLCEPCARTAGLIK